MSSVFKEVTILLHLRNPWFNSQESSQFLQFLRSLGKEIKYEKIDMDYLIWSPHSNSSVNKNYPKAVLQIWCWISWISMFFDLDSEPDPFHTGSQIRIRILPSIKNSKKNLDSYCFAVLLLFWLFIFSLVRGMDPRTWILIHTKMSCIRNTAQE